MFRMSLDPLSLCESKIRGSGGRKILSGEKRSDLLAYSDNVRIQCCYSILNIVKALKIQVPSMRDETRLLGS
jgi:hypothetical protein